MQAGPCNGPDIFSANSGPKCACWKQASGLLPFRKKATRSRKSRQERRFGSWLVNQKISMYSTYPRRWMTYPNCRKYRTIPKTPLIRTNRVSTIWPEWPALRPTIRWRLKAVSRPQKSRLRLRAYCCLRLPVHLTIRKIVAWRGMPGLREVSRCCWTWWIRHAACRQTGRAKQGGQKYNVSWWNSFHGQKMHAAACIFRAWFRLDEKRACR